MTTRTDRTTWWVDPAELDDSEADPSMTSAIETPDGKEANLVSSLLTDGRHSPALDLDFECRLVPSSTPGHFHLYLDGIVLDWDAYEELLAALEKAGIIGPGYFSHSLDRKMTVLRPEGVKKTKNQEPTPAFRSDPEEDPW